MRWRGGPKPIDIPETKLVWWADAGVSVKEQAELLGVCQATVIKRRRKLGLQRVRRAAHITRQDIKAADARGVTLGAFAREQGISRTCLTYRLVELGIKWETSRTFRPRTRDRIAFAVCAHDNHHLSFLQIGRALGVTKQSAHLLYRQGKNGK